MVAEDWTHLIRGTLSQADGLSCPPRAKAMVPVGTTATGMNESGDPSSTASPRATKVASAVSPSGSPTVASTSTAP